jgi:hypothetical protein
MDRRRKAFLEAFGWAGEILRRPDVGARWKDPSALAEFSTWGLAGHMVRSGARVLAYLDETADEAGDPIPAPAYYVEVMKNMTDSENKRVRDDGEATAASGWEALVEEHHRLRADLEERLPREPDDRVVKVFGGHLMLLDDYLETRIVEVLVHADDLAVSVGLTPPEPPKGAVEVAIAHLVEVARLGHGDRAVLMALTRRERDEKNALRIF